jgi:hypothetical protein
MPTDLGDLCRLISLNSVHRSGLVHEHEIAYSARLISLIPHKQDRVFRTTDQHYPAQAGARIPHN